MRVSIVVEAEEPTPGGPSMNFRTLIIDTAMD